MLHPARLLAAVVLLACLLLVPAVDAAVRPRMAAKGAAATVAPVITHVVTNRPYVSVTIDDFYTGDYNRRTAIRMLQAANAAKVGITLCPAGSALVAYNKSYPEQAAEIKQLFNAGNYELCNHTYSHPVLPRTGDAAVQEREIVEGELALKQFFGRTPTRLFRPPFGSWNAQTQQAATLAGYKDVVTWSIDSGDSEGPEKPVSVLLADVACARAGDIILMHANRRTSAEALPQILAMLRARGLQPVTLSTLLAAGTPAFSYSPADMRRLYTCPGAPSQPPVAPSAQPVPQRRRAPVPTNPAPAAPTPEATAAPTPEATATPLPDQTPPDDQTRTPSEPNKNPDVHNRPPDT